VAASAIRCPIFNQRTQWLRHYLLSFLFRERVRFLLRFLVYFCSCTSPMPTIFADVRNFL
jgi:hypothetical protein